MLFGSKSRVQAYTVHEKPNPVSERGDRAEQLLFVRDGFSFAAFLLAPIWMLSQRMWLAFLGYLVVVVAIVLGVSILGLDPRWSLYGVLAVHMLVGFEADSITRWTLDRKGWRQVSSVSGTTFEDCERRFFDHWLSTVPAVATANLTPPGTPGGLGPGSVTPDKPPPYRGEVIPPKRTNWRSGFSLLRRT